jgi:hypothetical protein
MLKLARKEPVMYPFLPVAAISIIQSAAIVSPPYEGYTVFHVRHKLPSEIVNKINSPVNLSGQELEAIKLIQEATARKLQALAVARAKKEKKTVAELGPSFPLGINDLIPLDKNNIIMVSGNRLAVEDVGKIIALLDTPIPTATVKIRVLSGELDIKEGSIPTPNAKKWQEILSMRCQIQSEARFEFSVKQARFMAIPLISPQGDLTLDVYIQEGSGGFSWGNVADYPISNFHQRIVLKKTKKKETAWIDFTLAPEANGMDSRTFGGFGNQPIPQSDTPSAPRKVIRFELKRDD